ncbi:ATP-binding cassette domain-containing protein [Clostridium sp. AM58-1XD]|uniref:ATP-binding cassette domain-containing protein n=1 Tax=Clostridium sp. AM58-1XD TaxID=2292307 RepID=UPI000E495CE4|nr:ATP-binding cassette domain-containing protein [Clostridium sp. AM58-1XD]RGY99259.1 ATP-binding cassette domain-containing protein [Clostridium sp. AM58-1XD]
MENTLNQTAAGQTAFLKLEDIVKIYGTTIANQNISIQIDKGDILGLVGANGAGKSTLMRIISGVSTPDQGEMYFDGEKIDWKTFSPFGASRKGIRVAYQELSLCDNLKVYENFYVELRQLFKGTLNWRKKAAELAKEQLELVFPENGIDVKKELSELSIAQQQMVEIARAFMDPELKLLILDEPTSSLPVEQTKQLLSYIKKKAADGVTFIYITHRLFEIIEVTNKVYILRNGAVVSSCLTKETDEDMLIELMSGEVKSEKAEGSEGASAETGRQGGTVNQNVCVQCRDITKAALHHVSCSMYGGEIIGIAGLEGNGQKDLLHAIFNVPLSIRKKIQRKGTIAYVTGDRKAEGNFPLWSIADNMAITSLMRKPLLAVNSPKNIVEKTSEWYDQLRIKGESPKADMISLSGGNQQKVLIARALLSNADIIILDDPTRGVDVETKRQLYEVFQNAAKEGKLVLWYSSDESELGICSRVFVMRYGTIVAALDHEHIDKDSIIEASFKAEEHKSKKLEGNSKVRLNTTLFMPVLAMITVYVICGLIRPNTFTLFGIELLISGSMPLILAALSQTYIIGLSHVNLGLGNFMGLVSVLAATILCENTALGLLLILTAWLVYGFMGLLIRKLDIPAVIVTLGFSFVWYGIALVLQSIPGGSSPQWLSSMFNDAPFGVQNVLIVLVIAIVSAAMIYRSRYGTVLRGFGNREEAMVRSGWGKYRAVFSIYMLSGFFAAWGGLSFTALTYSADAGSMDSYTLLTVASVVLGGGALNGGRVSHMGAAFGAITLSFVTILLGFLHVSSDFTAAVQGLMLIVILSLRLLKKGAEQ